MDEEAIRKILQHYPQIKPPKLTPRAVYATIEAAKDPLLLPEHQALFAIYWKDLQEKNQISLPLPEKLIKRFFENRYDIGLIYFGDMLEGKLQPQIFAYILRHCHLQADEEQALWDLFHSIASFEEYFKSSADTINKQLGIYEFLKPGATVLDVGCGKYAQGLVSLLKRDPTIQAYGVDLHFEQHPSNVHLLHAHAEHLPFEKEMFDLIYAMNLFQYLDDNRAMLAIQEALRVLKLGCVFVFNDNASRIPQLFAKAKLPVVRKWFFRKLPYAKLQTRGSGMNEYYVITKHT
jgi:ubiquinone/menaquinone biosynthesis C-methylase UbiE